MPGPQYAEKSGIRVVLKGPATGLSQVKTPSPAQKVTGHQDCLPNISVVITFSLGEKKNNGQWGVLRVHVREQGLNAAPSPTVGGLLGVRRCEKH